MHFVTPHVICHKTHVDVVFKIGMLLICTCRFLCRTSWRWNKQGTFVCFIFSPVLEVEKDCAEILQLLPPLRGLHTGDCELTLYSGHSAAVGHRWYSYQDTFLHFLYLTFSSMEKKLAKLAIWKTVCLCAQLANARSKVKPALSLACKCVCVLMHFLSFLSLSG